MWWYESHLGGIYSTPKRQTPDQLYCDECGDYDWEVGYADTPEEFAKLFFDKILFDVDDEDDCGYIDCKYIFPIFVKKFNLGIKLKYENKQDEESGFCSNDWKGIRAIMFGYMTR